MHTQKITKNKSNRKYLVLSGVLVIIFIIAILVVTSWFHLNAKSVKLNQVTDQHQTKTELVMTMWDIARARESTFQSMLIISDPFELDDLQIQHRSLAGRFVKARRLLIPSLTS